MMTITNSRTVSLVLAALVTGLSLLFLSLLNSANLQVMVVGGGITFSASFMLTYVVMEFLVFRGVNEVYELFDKLKEDQYEIKKQKGGLMMKPMKRINEELVDFARAKADEIEKLKKLELYRREFIADVSHELKTPLFAAQGYVLTLLDGAADDPITRDRFLKKAAKNLNGLDDLIQDLLTLSQIESGVIKMQFEVYGIIDQVNEVLEQLEDKAAKKGVVLELENQTGKDELYIFADYFRISQVLVNLLTNAIKYGQPNGKAKVILSYDEDYLKVIVKDNGPGIPEDDLNRIFERFYRVDKSRAKKSGGSGLGLAIVKHILENHNTLIKVKSELGVGTEFYFELPLGEIG